MANGNVSDSNHRADSGEGGGSGSAAGRDQRHCRMDAQQRRGGNSSLICPAWEHSIPLTPRMHFPGAAAWILRRRELGDRLPLQSAGDGARAGRNDDRQARRLENQQLPRLLRLQLWWRRCRGSSNLLIGLGATQYAEVTATVAGTSRDISSTSRFSGTGAFGVKVYPGENVGVLFEGRWTPTYITTITEGWWCDPYWGCYLVGDSRYRTSSTWPPVSRSDSSVLTAWFAE